MELLTDVAGEAVPLALAAAGVWAWLRHAARRDLERRLALELDTDTPTRRAWYVLASKGGGR